MFVVALIFPLFNTNQSQVINYEDQKVVYDLPYPGILPDNPLYFLKAIRDKAIDILTRDQIQKARLYLLFSDKRVNMSILLSKKGKQKLATTTLSKAEKYFEPIPNLLKQSKTQGVSPPEELVFRLRLSNSKHREIIQSYIKTFPQGEIEYLNTLLKLNEKIKKDLEAF